MVLQHSITAHVHFKPALQNNQFLILGSTAMASQDELLSETLPS